MSVHMTEQLCPLSFEVLTVSATRAASVKASLTPRFFMAEHSTKQSEILLKTGFSSYRLTEIA